ncbi:MAG TPA: orotidine-5'-phosphate decarboxylase [Alphaproteobacteria bacterium]|nr:orotidine-5'-phosphate decarboxylase [Alphaproteobacteria bacterium]
MAVTGAAPTPSARIFVALDTASVSGALGLARRLDGLVGGLKLGLEFFCAHGPAGVREVAALGLPIFLDLKLHDIPNTVAGGVRGAAATGPAFITLHAGGGPAMLRAAVAAATEAAGAHSVARPMLLGVTVMTSLDDDDLEAVGQRGPAAEQVLRLATLGQDCGLDGIVCSPHEVAAIRDRCGSRLKLMVPGVRPVWAAADDQKRVMTPAEAVRAGADWLVIGRPITRADDPAEAARRIAAEIAEG